ELMLDLFLDQLVLLGGRELIEELMIGSGGLSEPGERRRDGIRSLRGERIQPRRPDDGRDGEGILEWGIGRAGEADVVVRVRPVRLEVAHPAHGLESPGPHHQPEPEYLAPAEPRPDNVPDLLHVLRDQLLTLTPARRDDFKRHRRPPRLGRARSGVVQEVGGILFAITARTMARLRHTSSTTCIAARFAVVRRSSERRPESDTVLLRGYRRAKRGEYSGQLVQVGTKGMTGAERRKHLSHRAAHRFGRWVGRARDRGHPSPDAGNGN